VQGGWEELAGYEGIENVHLDASSTDFVLELLEKVLAGRSAKLGGTGT
jgi:hypothetical protein